MITITNNGAAIASTNYWESEHAMGGLCYLSGNAGTWRLLVPPEAETLLAEMRTGKTATIEPSLHIEGHWDVVFEDGSSNPFSVAIDPKQIDRTMEPGRCRLHVWTRRGREMDLVCKVKP